MVFKPLKFVNRYSLHIEKDAASSYMSVIWLLQQFPQRHDGNDYKTEIGNVVHALWTKTMNMNIRVGGGDIDGCQGKKKKSILEIFNHLWQYVHASVFLRRFSFRNMCGEKELWTWGRPCFFLPVCRMTCLTCFSSYANLLVGSPTWPRESGTSLGSWCGVRSMQSAPTTAPHTTPVKSSSMNDLNQAHLAQHNYLVHCNYFGLYFLHVEKFYF